MNQAVIDQCVKNTQSLLEDHWEEIQSMRDDEPNEKIKISVSFNICFRGDDQMIQTKIAFGVRKTDALESIINPNQLDLPLQGNGSEPNPLELETITPAKKRARKPTSAVPVATSAYMDGESNPF